jgi:hypothetical protein
LTQEANALEVHTFSYRSDCGWSVADLPELDSPQTLVLVFGGSAFVDQPAPFLELSQRYPTSHILGCSTAGEILGDSLADDSLVVAVTRFDQTKVASAFAPVLSASDSLVAGETLGHQLAAPDLRGVLVLSDGLGVNGSELVRGLNSALGTQVTVTGGLAADGDRFVRTWVLHEGQPRAGFVSAIGLYGPAVRFGHGSQGGWDLFGPERRVTRSEGNVLFELDGKPALQLYKQYLGDLAAGLPATGLLFPLALRSGPDDVKSLVRTILAVDEQTQSMTFAGDLPQGSLARLMRANLDRLIDGASTAAVMTQPHVAGPGLSIAISCVGRRLVLGERTEEEIEATLEAMPPHTQQIGFYSYGEISPYTDGACDLHNQTMTLTTIFEACAA